MDINQIHHVLSAPSLKHSELPSLQPCPASSSLVINTSSDIPDVIPDLLHVLHAASIQSSSVSLASFPFESAASVINSQHLVQQSASMSCGVTASVARHPAHRVAPVLSDGMVTPGVLLDWENACDDFFVAAKEPIADDKKVSNVTGSLQNSHISIYIKNNRAHLHALTFPVFMSELCETFLPADWDKNILRKIRTARMSINQSFYDFCIDIIMCNNLLTGGDLYMNEKHIRHHIFNNMTKGLHEKLEESPTKLAAMNTLHFQKWLNTIIEMDTKMVNALKWNAKRIATEPVTAVIENSSSVSGNEGDDNEENSDTVAMTEPAAIDFSDSNSDEYGVSPPLTVPNLYWHVNAIGHDSCFVKIKTMIDNGAHIVLIRPEIVDALGLERKRLHEPQLINVALNDKRKEKNFHPAMLSEFVSLTLLTLDNSWTPKKINAVIAPGLCTNILLGLPFLVHNRIVVDHEIPSAIMKDTNVDLPNFIPAPKSVPKIKKSPKRKHLEIKMFHRELLKELKWKCSILKAKIDKLSGNDTADSHFKAVNFVAAIKGRLETLELQQKYNALEESLKTEYAKIFEPIPHIDELPDDVYCRIKLRDATKTISKRTYGCPQKYREA